MTHRVDIGLTRGFHGTIAPWRDAFLTPSPSSASWYIVRSWLSASDVFGCDESKVGQVIGHPGSLFFPSSSSFLSPISSASSFFLAHFHDYIYCDLNLQSPKAKNKENVRLRTRTSVRS